MSKQNIHISRECVILFIHSSDTESWKISPSGHLYSWQLVHLTSVYVYKMYNSWSMSDCSGDNKKKTFLIVKELQDPADCIELLHDVSSRSSVLYALFILWHWKSHIQVDKLWFLVEVRSLSILSLIMSNPLFAWSLAPIILLQKRLSHPSKF